MLTPLLWVIITIALYMTAWYILALILKRNDLADLAWGLGFVVATISAQIYSDTEIDLRKHLVLILVALWGLRLAYHIFNRLRKKPEDQRYQEFRKNWNKKFFYLRAYLQIFILQGTLLLLVATPVIYIALSPHAPHLTPFDYIGLTIWLIGYFFEVVGDYQLKKFLSKKENKGKLMTKGLWKYTRHPNYFGEVTMWWGLYLIACSLPGGYLTIIGPITITILILKISGVPMLEEKYQGRTEFEEYKKHTNKFFPGPPK